MMKKILKDNSGYSLVELIIVIGMIAVLSGAAMLTLASVKTSRASAARDTFDQEIAALQARTKSQSLEEAIKIEKVDNFYYIYYGTSTDGTDFTAYDDSKADATLNRIDIYYAEDGSSFNELTEQVIKFSKNDGSVVCGSGKYQFCKDRSHDVVGTVSINKATGSHYTGN
jgi:prepilin-type N-terminal cleavage/methylation domain-containing protein